MIFPSYQHLWYITHAYTYMYHFSFGKHCMDEILLKSTSCSCRERLHCKKVSEIMKSPHHHNHHLTLQSLFYTCFLTLPKKRLHGKKIPEIEVVRHNLYNLRQCFPLLAMVVSKAFCYRFAKCSTW